MQVVDVYVERTMLGNFEPITKEEFENLCKEGYGNIEIINETHDGKPWKVHVAWLILCAWALSEEDYQKEANRMYEEYVNYVRGITGLCWGPDVK